MSTEKLLRRDAQLSSLVSYIRDTQAPRLHGYHGTDVDLILRLLRRPLPASFYNLSSATANGNTTPAGRPHTRDEPPAVVGRRTSSTLPPSHHWDHHVHDEEHDLMHEIAHGLHFASIAMLGFLVVEVNALDRTPTIR